MTDTAKPFPEFNRNDFGMMTLFIGRRWRHVVDAELNRSALTASTWRVLYYLGILGDGVRQMDLAIVLGMERSSLGQLVDKLEQETLIERRNDPADRRGKTLHMTPLGLSVRKKTLRQCKGVTDRLMRDVTDQEFATLQTIFTKINHAVDLESGG